MNPVALLFVLLALTALTIGFAGKQDALLAAVRGHQ